MKYLFLYYITVCITIGSAVSASLKKRELGLQVEIKHEEGAHISLSLTNTGDKNLRLLNFGTALDERALSAFSVSNNGRTINNSKS